MPGGNVYKSNDTNLDNYEIGICFVSVVVPDSDMNPVLRFRDINGNT